MRNSCSILRIKVTAVFLALFAAWAIQAAGAAEGTLAPVILRCEYLKNPLGIDVRLPRFAWVDRHTGRAQMQSAYQVLVASSPELLAQNKGDQWDSGKTASDDSTQVVYNGKPLESDHSYWWKVRYWDKAGTPATTASRRVSTWRCFPPTSGRGNGLAAPTSCARNSPCRQAPRRARAYICGLGYYELRINGAKIGRTTGSGLDHVSTNATSTPPTTLRRNLPPRRERGGRDAGRGLVSIPALLLLQMDIELASGKTRERDQRRLVEGQERPHRERQCLGRGSLRRAAGNAGLGPAGIRRRRLEAGANRERPRRRAFRADDAAHPGCGFHGSRGLDQPAARRLRVRHGAELQRLGGPARLRAARGAKCNCALPNCCMTRA